MGSEKRTKAAQQAKSESETFKKRIEEHPLMVIIGLMILAGGIVAGFYECIRIPALQDKLGARQLAKDAIILALDDYRIAKGKEEYWITINLKPSSMEPIGWIKITARIMHGSKSVIHGLFSPGAAIKTDKSEDRRTATVEFAPGYPYEQYHVQLAVSEPANIRIEGDHGLIPFEIGQSEFSDVAME